MSEIKTETAVELWTDDTHTEYAICVEGDQVFRKTTDPSARYTHRIVSWTEPGRIEDLPFQALLDEQVRICQEG